MTAAILVFMNNTVAETISSQIGRGTFAMLGAKNLVGDNDSLQFAIQGCKKINRIRVTLASDDTYTVTFYKVGKFDWATVREVEMVYADSLHAVIGTETGLATTMGVL
jgi:hypothetical protein